jgi:hypothetical protein
VKEQKKLIKLQGDEEITKKIKGKNPTKKNNMSKIGKNMTK